MGQLFAAKMLQNRGSVRDLPSREKVDGPSRPRKLQAREWAKAVLSGTVQRTWLCASAISVVASYSPWLSANIAHFIRPWAWAVFAVGFSVANLAAYSEVLVRARNAEAKLEGVIITLDGATAKEELRPEKAYHFVVVKFALTARN